MYNKTIGLILSVAILHGCAESTSPGSNTGGNNNFQAPGTTGSTDNNLANRIPGEVYYTGFDGFTDLTILDTTSRTLEVEDNTVASVILENITIPDATVTEMINELKATGETLSANREQRLRERLSQARAWKITPKKPGVTYIKATRAPSSSTNQIRWESVWYKPELRTLVVSDYSGGMINTGKIRYDQGGGTTTSPACISCHIDTSTVGAPAHQIGRVAAISDADAISWINTGRAGDRVFQEFNAAGHSWTFNSDAEKAATVAYLRSQQTKDLKELARLLFDEVLAEAKADNIQ